MLRLTKFFFTLPLLSLPLWGLSPHVQAEAVLTQMDALRLLAKSRAADGKCKILPAGEAEELGRYLARAEVAAATRNSVSEIQSSVGKALGDTATCSEATSAPQPCRISPAGLRLLCGTALRISFAPRHSRFLGGHYPGAQSRTQRLWQTGSRQHGAPRQGAVERRQGPPIGAGRIRQSCAELSA